MEIQERTIEHPLQTWQLDHTKKNDQGYTRISMIELTKTITETTNEDTKSRKSISRPNNESLASENTELFPKKKTQWKLRRFLEKLPLLGKLRLPKLSTRQRTTLAIICYENFFIASCIALQGPFFPEEAARKGASPTEYGLVFGVFELVSLITSPILGKIVHVVSPSFQIKAGAFIAGNCSILFGILDRAPYGKPFLQLAFLVRSVEAIGSAAIITSGFVLAAMEFPDQVAIVFSTIQACFGLGLIFGPSLGGFLYQVGGYILPFTVLGGLLLFGSALATLFIKDTEEAVPKKPGDILKFLANVGTILDLLSTTTAIALVGFNSATLEPHLTKFNLSPAVTGAIFMLYGIGFGLSSPLWGKICSMGFLHRNTCALGCALSSSGIILIGPLPGIPFLPKLWIVITSVILCSLGVGAKLVASLSGCHNETIKFRGFPDDVITSGMISSLIVAASSFGAFYGPSLGGWLLDEVGYQNGTAVMLGCDLTLMVALILHTFWQKTRQENLPSCATESETAQQ